jgi:hypothetical protein
VQIIEVLDESSGEVPGVLVKYACHPVTMSLIGLGADYPGFIVEELQRAHRGLHVQFLQGCTGDCRPILVDEAVTRFIPGTLELCKTFGESLAASVERALEKPARALSGPILHRSTTIELPIRILKREDYEAESDSTAWFARRWAMENLRALEAGSTSPTIPFRIQIFRIGENPENGVQIVGLDGEVFSGYAHMLRSELAPWPAIALAYCNAMAGYIPTAEEFPKGGYEVNAYVGWNRPGPFLPEIERLIIDATRRLAEFN